MGDRGAVSAQFLAFDLGAESGRAILGRLNDGLLDVRELHRFPNDPVRQSGRLQWDIFRLWLEMRRSLERLPTTTLDSIGVDTWGCDYALIAEDGSLLQNPYHYRDSRTDGVMEAVFQRLPADEIYAVTGIQFLPFNTLFQLYAHAAAAPKVLSAARALLTIPDLLNYWLTGELAAEFTNATTTQFVDAHSRSWASRLFSKLDLPVRLLPPLIEPGTTIGHVLPDVSAALAGHAVVAPACHDTGSAVASVNVGGGRAFLSSGTWSLLGTEVPAPIITPRSRELNFTNEGGVCGTTRLLKNIAGMTTASRWGSGTTRSTSPTTPPTSPSRCGPRRASTRRRGWCWPAVACVVRQLLVVHPFVVGGGGTDGGADRRRRSRRPRPRRRGRADARLHAELVAFLRGLWGVGRVAAEVRLAAVVVGHLATALRAGASARRTACSPTPTGSGTRRRSSGVPTRSSTPVDRGPGLVGPVDAEHERARWSGR